MLASNRWTLFSLVIANVIALAFPPIAGAVLYNNFNEAYTTVNGYQDDFGAPTLNSDWVEFDGGNDDGPLFVLSGIGSLLMNPAASDPNKLLYNPGTAYANGGNGVQEVLALIRVNGGTFNNDGFRGGVGAAQSSGSGQGINLLFRGAGQNGTGEHFNLLNDAIAWGPATPGPTDWNVGSYFWLRLQYLDDTGAGDDAFAKIWPAGLTPEPGAFNLSWNQAGRSGLAALATNSGGNGQFEVDYVLIKAAGLPEITVVPEPSSLGLLATSSVGLVLATRRRKEKTRS